MGWRRYVSKSYRVNVCESKLFARWPNQMLVKYLAIFRVINNFVIVGDARRTPAMRLGFAKEPLSFEGLIWPGERVPRPKRARRRGEKAIAA